ncbi:MAG: alpha/beta hydrolase [Candidatus Sericytochromatia bacterium]
MSRRLALIALTAAFVGGLPGCAQGPSGYAGMRTSVGASASMADSNRQQFFGELMGPLDANRDGALQREEAHDTWLQSDFDRLDANRDATLDRAELDRFIAGKPEAQSEGFGGAVGVGAGLIGVGLAGYLAYAGMVGSTDLMFPAREDFRRDPAAYQMPFEKVDFKSHDGLKLAGWYVPAAVKTDKALLILHGHGSNKDSVFRKYGNWLRQKYNVFLYDQRHAGESEGKFVSLGYLERQDAVLALEQLRRRGNTQLGVFGESMGGAVAINTAATVPDVKCVVTDCAFDSMVDAVGPRAAARKYPLPGLVAQSVVKTASLRAGHDLDDADPVKWVAKIAPRPFFLIHGMQDHETVPMNGEKLFAAAQEPKQAWWPANSKHCTAWKDYPDEYKQRVFGFLEKSL